MRSIFEYMIILFLRFILWFRYKVTYVGLDKLNKDNLNKPGGVLFLPNHPAVFVDPVLITIGVWNRFPIRPMVIEYMYYNPAINWVMRFIKALPVPNFETAGNSLKRKKNEHVFDTVVQGLQAGDNFLIYPGGSLKQTHLESLKGNSGVHRILQDAPETNVVMVRIKGLWGSQFSRAITGATPNMFKVMVGGIKSVFKNLLFFTPRRRIIIEYCPVADLPVQASRREFNRHLEDWYNLPDGLSKQEGDHPGDSLIFVSTSMWGKVYPEITAPDAKVEKQIEVDKVPDVVKQKVLEKLQEMTSLSADRITPEMSLAMDLSLDSLDISELLIFLKDQFDVDGVPYKELTTVKKLMALASGQIVCKEEIVEEEKEYPKWNKPIKERKKIDIAPGETVAEAFLNNCARQKKALACVDLRAGVMNYSQLKMRALVLADYIRTLPGDYIGIMLPSTVVAYVVILATQLAGKVPLMVNWTVGPRHLDSVVKLSNVQVILSSWAFLDKLQDVDLTPIEDILVMLEDVRHKFTLKSKLKAFYWSKRNPQAILKKYSLKKMTKDDLAVLLFTSGTESMPKGVPLTHENILSNQRSALQIIDFYSDDIFCAFLPPFHAFGFNVSGLFGLLSGLRMAFSPSPTDSKALVKAIERWKATVTCGTPTFLRGIIKSALPGQLDTLRMCVTGAEKAPPQLFHEMSQIGKREALIEGYGITECSPVLTANDFGKPNRGVGKAIPNVELRIVHPETYAPLKQGEQGLIIVKGPNVFKGYLNPGLASPFITFEGDQWYKTGDLGFLDKDNNLTISGRMKRFVKIGAEMISLPAVEDALLQAVLDKKLSDEDGSILALCAKEQDGGKTKLFLFTKFSVTVDDVNKIIRDAGFSNLVKVSAVIHIKEIPLMGSGKINYRELESEYLNKQMEIQE